MIEFPKSETACQTCKRKMSVWHNGSNHIIMILCPDCTIENDKNVKEKKK